MKLIAIILLTCLFLPSFQNQYQNYQYEEESHGESSQYDHVKNEILNTISEEISNRIYENAYDEEYNRVFNDHYQEIQEVHANKLYDRKTMQAFIEVGNEYCMITEENSNEEGKCETTKHEVVNFEYDHTIELYVLAKKTKDHDGTWDADIDCSTWQCHDENGNQYEKFDGKLYLIDYSKQYFSL